MGCKTRTYTISSFPPHSRPRNGNDARLGSIGGAKTQQEGKPVEQVCYKKDLLKSLNSNFPKPELRRRIEVPKVS